MAAKALKTLAILALTGTSLSGCAMINDAADDVWSGTKTVAHFVSSPVRSLLRDAPKDDVQFAAVETETMDTSVQAQDDTAMMSTTMVAQPQPQTVGSATTSTSTTWQSVPSSTYVPASTYTARTNTQTPASSTWSGTTSGAWSNAQPTVQINETITTADNNAVDVLTVGAISYVRTNGVGSLEDWRMCDVQAGGFWKFDSASAAGTLNPEFETCMRRKNYVQQTELGEGFMSDFNAAQQTTSPNPLP